MLDISKPVICKDCKKEYMCTPNTDYYDFTTNTDGKCWNCMLTDAGMSSEEPTFEKDYSIHGDVIISNIKRAKRLQ